MELPICVKVLLSLAQKVSSWRLSFEPGLFLCRAKVVVDRKKPSMTQSALEGIIPAENILVLFYWYLASNGEPASPETL